MLKITHLAPSFQTELPKAFESTVLPGTMGAAILFPPGYMIPTRCLPTAVICRADLCGEGQYPERVLGRLGPACTMIGLFIGIG